MLINVRKSSRRIGLPTLEHDHGATLLIVTSVKPVPIVEGLARMRGVLRLAWKSYMWDRGRLGQHVWRQADVALVLGI